MVTSKISTSSIEAHLKTYQHTFKHWGFLGNFIELVPESSNRYLLKVLKDDKEVFPSTPDCSFQIHFDPEERLIALFVKSFDRGWFLETLDIWDVEDIKMLLVKLFSNSHKNMQEIHGKYLKEIS
jgi:hypothetical protein